MEQDKFLRQRDVFLPEHGESWPAVIVGAGGIGSWTTFVLAKLGLPELTVYDFDKVEPHNLPSQFFRESDVGKPKVQALSGNVQMFTGQKINIKNEKFNAVNTRLLIVAVDSIEERLRIYNEYKKLDIFPDYVVDARMGLEQLEIYVCRNPQDWADTFPVDIKHVDKDPCTARSIAYNTSVIGGMITSLVKKIVMGERHPRKVIFDLKTYMIVT